MCIYSCIIVVSLLHHVCVTFVSLLYHVCITSASLVYHLCILLFLFNIYVYQLFF